VDRHWHKLTDAQKVLWILLVKNVPSISQGSVVTQLKCSGIFTDLRILFTAKLESEKI